MTAIGLLEDVSELEASLERENNVAINGNLSLARIVCFDELTLLF
jgi:hypothetical protein